MEEKAPDSPKYNSESFFGAQRLLLKNKSWMKSKSSSEITMKQSLKDCIKAVANSNSNVLTFWSAVPMVILFKKNINMEFRNGKA